MPCGGDLCGPMVPPSGQSSAGRVRAAVLRHSALPHNLAVEPPKTTKNGTHSLPAILSSTQDILRAWIYSRYIRPTRRTLARRGRDASKKKFPRSARPRTSGALLDTCTKYQFSLPVQLRSRSLIFGPKQPYGRPRSPQQQYQCPDAPSQKFSPGQQLLPHAGAPGPAGTQTPGDQSTPHVRAAGAKSARGATS